MAGNSAYVYGIVKQSEGNIWVYSEPDKGTNFKIYLPQTEEQGTRLEAPATADRIPGGSETILVVEDDEVVRQLVTRILQSGGYRMLEASDGSNALQICQQCEGQIELVLTDLVMPQMSGPALTEKLKELYPGIRIVYTSGYADDAIVRHGHLDPGMPFIQKPFSPNNLLQKVREVLDNGTSHS
jgi:two-component system cell cycle sensor histidine kinase/response regulator CckA